MNNELKIDKLKSKGIIPGLEPEFAICNCFGNPQDNIKTIHIAGTNGKGSVGFFIQRILISCNLKVGRYSSPAVYKNNEVIDINGEFISEQDYKIYTDKVVEMADKNNISLTQFEAEVASAYLYFKDKKVDFAVIECGMGGKLDATNVIKSPELSVIPSISMDHMAFLGDTLEEITHHKCGIIKKDSPVAVGCGALDSLDIIKKYAEENNSKIFLTDKSQMKYKTKNLEGFLFSYKDVLNTKIKFNGVYQTENAALAIESFYALKEKYNLSPDFKDVFKPFDNSSLFGRFSRINQNPLIIADGAHNEGAARKLKENIKYYFEDKKVSFIFGAFRDKEYLKCADLIFPTAHRIFVVDAVGKRAVSSFELYSEIQKKYDNVSCCSNYESAIISAYLSDSDVTIAFGSLSYLKYIKKACENLLSNSNRRIKNILENKLFLDTLKIIDYKEKDRIFCRHGFTHLVKTAEICLKLNDEYKLDIPKDIIFATAFMHDLGRCEDEKNNISHEILSVQYAEKILSECGYTSDEIKIVSNVILSHRKKSGSIKTFEDIFFMADKFSRNCSMCKAYDECNWNLEEKKHTMKYF